MLNTLAFVENDPLTIHDPGFTITTGGGANGSLW